MPHTCRNSELNAVDAGKQQTYPRSCGICKFGPCQKHIIVPGPMSKYSTPVAPAEPKVENKYAAIIEESYSRDDGYGGYDSVKYETFKSFDSEAALVDWYKEKVLGAAYSRPIVKRLIRYQELRAITEVQVKLG